MVQKENLRIPGFLEILLESRILGQWLSLDGEEGSHSPWHNWICSVPSQQVQTSSKRCQAWAWELENQVGRFQCVSAQCCCSFSSLTAFVFHLSPGTTMYFITSWQEQARRRDQHFTWSSRRNIITLTRWEFYTRIQSLVLPFLLLIFNANKEEVWSSKSGGF